MRCLFWNLIISNLQLHSQIFCAAVVFNRYNEVAEAGTVTHGPYEQFTFESFFFFFFFTN